MKLLFISFMFCLPKLICESLLSNLSSELLPNDWSSESKTNGLCLLISPYISLTVSSFYLLSVNGSGSLLLFDLLVLMISAFFFSNLRIASLYPTNGFVPYSLFNLRDLNENVFGIWDAFAFSEVGTFKFIKTSCLSEALFWSILFFFFTGDFFFAKEGGAYVLSDDEKNSFGCICSILE